MNSEFLSEEYNIFSSYKNKLDGLGLIPDNTEIEYYKKLILDSIISYRPIQLIHTNNHLGDHFIIRAAFEEVLSRFAIKHQITNRPIISLSHKRSATNLLLPSSFIAARGIKPYRDEIGNMYHAYLMWLACHLDIEIEDTFFLKPPLPYTCDFENSPMINFSWTKVNEYLVSLSSSFNPDLRYCIILHGGSNPLKRFGTDQILTIRDILSSLFPRNAYIILTAQNYDLKLEKDDHLTVEPNIYETCCEIVN